MLVPDLVKFCLSSHVCIEKSIFYAFLVTLAFIDGNSVSLIIFEWQRHACARFGVILLVISCVYRKEQTFMHFSQDSSFLLMAIQ